jgi:ribosomal protein L15
MELGKFPSGSDHVNFGFGQRRTLQSRGLVSGRAPVKCLATGTLPHALTVRVHAFSGKAREAIQAAGGSAEVVGA